MIYLLLVAGLVLLVLGAEILVRGASNLATAFGIPSLIVGLTVVAFGTSSPELAVSIQSAYAGQADIALGNVVGSNIFNILLILGISALITPLAVSRQLVRLDVPIMIVVSLLVVPMGWDGRVGRFDGIVLTALLLAYIGLLIHLGRKEGNLSESAPEADLEFNPPRHWSLNVVFILIGLAMLVMGSKWLVDGAVAIARGLGVSELVVGLTIIAGGTSLPEVATSVIASLRGERDIAVGNVVGSCIFNILAVLGVSSIVAPLGIRVAAEALTFDVPLMIAVSIACLPVFFSGSCIDRWEGGIFLGYYVAYTAFLIMNATGHAALPYFTTGMVGFVIPLTVLTLAVVGFRDWRALRQG
jgi:cation:H+ antiporter